MGKVFEVASSFFFINLTKSAILMSPFLLRILMSDWWWFTFVIRRMHLLRHFNCSIVHMLRLHLFSQSRVELQELDIIRRGWASLLQARLHQGVPCPQGLVLCLCL